LDNLTHSLAGALLGQLGLKQLTGRAMGTLVIAANIPDIDAIYAFAGPSLGFRRGITHGPLAMLVLPVLLTAAVLLWNRWRPSQRPVSAWAVFLLAFIGTLSHPVLDWLNSYGIRFLEPFSHRWFYGDTLFIIDVWLWLALLAAVHRSQILERHGRPDWRGPAIAGLGAILVYIAANFTFSTIAERRTVQQLGASNVRPSLVVANPVPLTPWRRTMLWRTAEVHGYGSFVLGQGLRLNPAATPNRLDDPALARAAKRDEVVRAFLFWSRMPVVIERGGKPYLADQRFLDPSRRRRLFLVPLDGRP